MANMTAKPTCPALHFWAGALCHSQPLDAWLNRKTQLPVWNAPGCKGLAEGEKTN